MKNVSKYLVPLVKVLIIGRGVVGLVIAILITYSRFFDSEPFVTLSFFENTPWLLIIIELATVVLFVYLVAIKKWKHFLIEIEEIAFNENRVGALIIIAILSTICIGIARMLGDNVPWWSTFLPLCTLVIWVTFLKKITLFFLIGRKKHYQH